MDWDKLKIFHAVAEAGSFTKATVNLNLSQSAISRQIQSLEQNLKVQLFERHARGLTLIESIPHNLIPRRINGMTDVFSFIPPAFPQAATIPECFV